jgi:asparagine N-glycosylation enzyme membrane subunit Stt3
MAVASWKETVVALPDIWVSLLPKLICPACWPAYSGVISALRPGFLVSAKYLLALTALFLGFTLVALAFRSSRRHGRGPFWLGLIAATTILIGKFGLESAYMTYSGISLLIAASVWNSWPRSAAISRCEARAPQGALGRKNSLKQRITSNVAQN